MLTSNKLQEVATPRSKDPLSSTAANVHNLNAKAGGLEWCGVTPDIRMSGMEARPLELCLQGSPQCYVCACQSTPMGRLAEVNTPTYTEAAGRAYAAALVLCSRALLKLSHWLSHFGFLLLESIVCGLEP